MLLVMVLPISSIADAAHDDRHGALAEAADEAEDAGGEDAGQRQRQGDADETSGPALAPSSALASRYLPVDGADRQHTAERS